MSRFTHFDATPSSPTLPFEPYRLPAVLQILWSILEGKTEAHDRFVISHLDKLYKHLAESLALAQPAAKKHRLKCLLSLVKKLDLENFEFIPSILPEVSCGLFAENAFYCVGYKVSVYFMN